MADQTENTKTNPPSTIQSYVESATGAVQSALGSLTGNSDKKAEGEVRKDSAQTEYNDSKAAVKVPGATLSSSGAVAKDDPERTTGSWNQTVGAAKETAGNVIGDESLKESGRQQNVEGQKQEAKGQLSDLGSGMANRAKGAVGEAASALKGDKETRDKFENQRAEGKAQQRGAEHDISKQAEAKSQQ